MTNARISIWQLLAVAFSTYHCWAWLAFPPIVFNHDKQVYHTLNIVIIIVIVMDTNVDF